MRLIDADALVEKLKKLYAMAFAEGDSAYHSAYRSLAKIVEDATTVGGWIPVSERLPETIGEYLITALSKPSRNAIVSAGYYHERLKEFGTFRPCGAWEKWDVVAWMPLPQAYKGE